MPFPQYGRSQQQITCSKQFIYGMVFSSYYVVLLVSVVRREAGEYTCFPVYSGKHEEN